MNLHGDFHIHTALSPCGDGDMTPNNIVNMAKLKGLQAIAITDHNSTENVFACMEVGRDANLTVIPGMELQTREDVHVICLFKNLMDATAFQEFVYKHLPNRENNERVFGEQLQFNTHDEVIGKNRRLLLTAANISFDEAFYEVSKLGGAFIPAHIDRDANSILGNLGFIPDYLNIKTLEYRCIEKVNGFIKKGILKPKFNFIKSSDAHYLGDILDEGISLDCKNNDIDSIINELR